MAEVPIPSASSVTEKAKENAVTLVVTLSNFMTKSLVLEVQGDSLLCHCASLLSPTTSPFRNSTVITQCGPWEPLICRPRAGAALCLKCADLVRLLILVFPNS